MIKTFIRGSQRVWNDLADDERFVFGYATLVLSTISIIGLFQVIPTAILTLVLILLVCSLFSFVVYFILRLIMLFKHIMKRGREES